MKSSTSPSAVTATIIGSIACLILYFFARLRAARAYFKKLEKAGLDIMPGHSSLWGHMMLVDKVSRTLPKGITMDHIVMKIAEDFPNGMCYMDVWPMNGPLLIITAPTAANQLSDRGELLKPIDVSKTFDIISAGQSMFTMQKEHWRTWRGMYNPSFSPGYLQELAPVVVEETRVFCDILREHVRDGDIFKLETLTTRLTLDVIGRTTLDITLGHQRKQHPLAYLLHRQAAWLSISKVTGPWKELNPIRHYVLWDNNRRMKRIIGDELEKRFTEAKASSVVQRGFGKSIMSQALKSYMKETAGASTLPLDKQFKATTISNVIFFMLAGNDTTSSTICFCYHNIYKNADVLLRIRAEHDAVFGMDMSAGHIESVIRQEPERLNQLPYTTAVIKETLRLHPPVAMARTGLSAVNLTDDAGKTFPTAGAMPWIVHAAIHRNPKYWKDPNTFIPERWLVKEGDPLYPVKGAWRPFEWGPRSCIGQSLAMMEIRVALLMTVREFVIRPQYSESDEEYLGSKAWLTDGDGLGGKPWKRYPARVSLVN